MKRFWKSLFQLAGLFAVLTAPVVAAESDVDMDDINAAMGSLSARMATAEEKLALKIFGDVRVRLAYIHQEEGLKGKPGIQDVWLSRFRARIGVSKEFGDF